MDAITQASGIDPWFLSQLAELIEAERWFAGLAQVGAAELRRMKRMGFTDRQLATLRGHHGGGAARAARALGVHPAYKTVDTCAGEFPSSTPYLYSSYDDENESEPFGDQGIVILGSGPNRIGQGVEFDYCCVRAGLAFRELGYKTIMINSNPETVSTDFDISDKLYFEPLTFEDVLEIVRWERPKGVVVQLGGQTPLRLTKALEAAGIPILGTSPDAIDIAEDRERFEAAGPPLGDHAAAQRHGALGRGGAARSPSASATRCSSAPRTCSAAGPWRSCTMRGRCATTSRKRPAWRPEHPVLIDRFLEDAFEADVDAISDGHRCVIGGVMQHIEDAGVHSGDSACVLPPYLIGDRQVEEMRRYTQGVRRGPGRGRADQRAVRDQGRRGLRPGGESAGLAHGPLRQQGHRGAAGEAGRRGHGRPFAGRSGAGRRASRSPAWR